MKIGDIYDLTVKMAYWSGSDFYFKEKKFEHRVLAFDKFHVFYDTFSSELDDWEYNNILKKRKYFSFWRAPREIFLEENNLRNEPLSGELLSIIQGDLPFRFGRFQNISWTDSVFESKDSIIGFFSQLEIELPLSKFYLQPIGKRGGGHVPNLLIAEGGANLSIIELLYQASKIRLTKNKSKSEGIGFYRSGVKNGIPVYYLGEFADLTGFIPPA